jgi:hypothetical protein
MIREINGKVYVEIPDDAVDAMTLAFLYEGREGVSNSIDDTIRRIADNGLGAHHMSDLRENTKYLQAFDDLIHYYGG